MTRRVLDSLRRLRVVARALAGSFFLASIAQAQAPVPTGRIVGRVIDAASGLGLSDVGIQVVGTTLGAMSGVDGRYTIKNVPAGTVTIQFRRIGFTPKTVTGIMLGADKTLEQDVTLSTAAITLAAQTVTASAERGSVADALDAQRTATGIVNAITAEQIAKSPDSDAAQAVQRVSGVTVQDGRYVFVRGLGERYTVTQLNGARMPSPEPERRVVPLDLFPTGMLQTVTTSKTFTPDQQGDFSGAQVDIRTREFPARRTVTWQSSAGYNSGATGKSVLGGVNAGGEPFAMGSSNRALPALVRSVGNFQNIELNQGDKNRLVGTFRDAWTPAQRNALPNGSMAMSVGGNDPVFGQRIGYLLSGTYSYSEELRTSQRRALAQRGSTPGSTNEIDRFEGETANQGTLWGGLLNLSTMLGGSTRVSLNNTYNRTSDNDARIERGSFENEGINARIDRMQYVERAVRSSQLAVEHQFGERHKIDWQLTTSGVRRDEPDRSEFVSEIVNPGASNERLLWLSTGNGGAVRTFSTLTEDSNEGRANYLLTLNAFGRSQMIKVGGLWRGTDRDADSRSYSISAPRISLADRALPASQLFDGRFTTPTSSVFEIAPLSQGGAYTASDRLAAGYLMADLGLTDRLRLITGARYERDDLTVNAQSTLGQPVVTQKQWNDLLPSAALNVKLSEYQSIRFSVSRTLARPEYRELSPIKSRDVLNGDDLEGNPNLVRTRIDNADIRWEWYPDAAEIVSVSLFAKQFSDPIERVYKSAGAQRFLAYVNAEKATNYGVELEVRKSLGMFAQALRPLTAFTNLTVMSSTITLGDSARQASTNPSRAMVGQAPYVLNAGLTYASTTGATSATLLFNRVGERIDAAGDQPLPDVKDLARNVLDLSLRFPIVGSLSGKFDARNLLDAPYQTVQGTVVREYWRTGRTIQLGFQFRP
ncbi:MAG: TonB-dependent receptor [Gemmatimonadaceae bacterium]